MANDQYSDDADEIQQAGDEIGQQGADRKSHSVRDARQTLKQGRENLKEGQNIVNKAKQLTSSPTSGISKAGQLGKTVGKMAGKGGQYAGKGGAYVGKGIGKAGVTYGKNMVRAARLAKLGVGVASGGTGFVAMIAVEFLAKHKKLVIGSILIFLIVYITFIFVFVSIILCVKKFVGNNPIDSIRNTISAITGNKSCDNPADAVADANKVTVTKTAPVEIANPSGNGPDLKYAITIAFSGQAQDITITDNILTPNVTFVSASGTHTTAPPGDGPDTKTITWSAKANGFPFGGGGTSAACGQKMDVPAGADDVGDLCSQANRSDKLSVVSKKPKDNGFYEPTYFGCSQGFPKDGADNCIPACPISSIPECAGLTGRACEEKLNYFAANASQYGCGAVLKVTNPTNGKAVIVRVIDEGPNCSVQQANAKFDISQAAYEAIGANGTVKVEKVAAGTKVGPVNSCTDGGAAQPQPAAGTDTKGGTTYEVVVRPKTPNSYVVNQAKAEVMGAGTGDTTTGPSGYKAPSDNNCSGKYSSAVINKTPMKKNFGDPVCDFSKDKLYSLLKEKDPKNADSWYKKIIPCESGYNPNAYASPATGTPDGAGAWGLFQMGSSKPPGTAPPSPGKNGVNDRGDVSWETQVENATTYGKKINSLGAYWACAR